jgi:hypothetical protein
LLPGVPPRIPPGVRTWTSAAQLPSFKNAAFALSLSGVSISTRHVGRIAHAIGQEMLEDRADKLDKRRRRELPVRVANPAEVVAVEVDGGRLRTREPGCGPGVHHKEYKEDKIACLVSLTSEVQQEDPQPQPPESFLQPRRVQRLVQQIKRARVQGSQEQDALGEPEEPKETPGREELEVGRVKKKVRTCVASMACSRDFGPMVAAEAQQRGFFEASRKAFIADGAAYNWSIQKAYFKDFEPIVDFLHVVCYLYCAATAVTDCEQQQWSTYVDWLVHCWQGRPQQVLDELEQCQQRLGKPPPDEEIDENDPRKRVAEALSYLSNNQSRMDYPRYRRQGLPITSSLAESLVGEFNARVKGRTKFWNRPQGAETILQVRAAVLSEDDRLERHFEERPGNVHRRRKPG